LNVRVSQCSSGKSARFPVVWSRRLSLGDKSGNTADHTCPPIRQRRKLGAARIRAGMRTGSKAGEQWLEILECLNRSGESIAARFGRSC
jgi:hypothetical protein